MSITREELRARIDMLECLESVYIAVDELHDMERDLPLNVDFSTADKNLTYMRGVKVGHLIAVLNILAGMIEKETQCQQ